MNIKECYDKMGADFNEVMQRLEVRILSNGLL